MIQQMHENSYKCNGELDISSKQNLFNLEHNIDRNISNITTIYWYSFKEYVCKY